MATVSGMAAIGGFSRTITTARKQDQKLYEQATVETANLIESGTKLATRALAWGTFYAVLGTGSLVYGIWKLSGAKSVSVSIANYTPLSLFVIHTDRSSIVFVFAKQMDEFRYKMGSILPKLSKDTQTSRTEFEGLNDLMEYVSTVKKT